MPDQGNTSAALELLQRAATLTEEIRHPRRGATAKFFYAQALMANGEIDKAIVVAQQARALIVDQHPASLLLTNHIDTWLTAHNARLSE